MPYENIASKEQRQIIQYLYDHELDGTRDRVTRRFKVVYRSSLKRELKIFSNSSFEELARNGYIRQVRRGPLGIVYFRRRGVTYVLSLFRHNAQVRQALLSSGVSDSSILNSDKYQIRSLFPTIARATGAKSQNEVFKVAQPDIKIDQEVIELLKFISKSGANVDVSSLTNISELARVDQRDTFNSVVERLLSAGFTPPVDYLDVESAPYVCWITTEGKNAVTYLMQRESSRQKGRERRSQK